MARTFNCQDCGKSFSLSDEVLARYPNWTPRQCMDCRGKAGVSPVRKAASPARRTTVVDTTERETGIFTDGACEGNPGPGGWGAVKVLDDTVIEERCGHAPQTTNNRMELTALIEGYEMLAPGEATPIYSDSQLGVKTVTTWAAGWERDGWTRRSREPIANLDLVKRLYALAKQHPEAELRWVKGHAGLRWNEYADRLSRSYQLNKAAS